MTNYGSLLQAFALQHYLENKGYEVENISIDKIKKDLDKRKISYFIKEAKDLSIILNKAGRIKKMILRKVDKSYNLVLAKREKRVSSFRNSRITISKPMDWKELSEFCGTRDAVLVGSDQLWLPSNIVADYYTLSFVPDSVNKVAFSTSFGVSDLSDKFASKAKTFLKRFDAISVREKTGKRIIDRLGLDSTVVCDPTMLLTKEQWREAIPEKDIIGEEYIFCYFLGTKPEHRDLAKRLKERTGLKVVALIHCEQYVRNDGDYADITPYDIGPEEFVNLIRNAKYILTDSFHGTVFSIIHNKNFFTFIRHSDEETLSTNSRIYDMADTLGIRDRVKRGNEDVESLMKENIDYNAINEKVAELREASRDYLLNALNRTGI